VQSGLSSEFQYAWSIVLEWFARHETLLIFFAILLEEAGIPMPLPADLAMALAGFRVAQGQMHVLQAFFIGQSATLIGSSLLYWIGRRGGRVLLFRYGKLLHLTPRRISQAERLILRHGLLAIIIGRQIPGLRVAAPLLSGVFRIPYRHFVPAMFVGSSIYIGIFIGLGMWGGPAALSAIRAHGLPLRFITSTALLLLTGLALWVLNRRAREAAAPARRAAHPWRRCLEAALLAGFGASAMMGLFTIWSLELIGLVTGAPPERAFLQFLESSPAPALASALTSAAPPWLIVTGLTATVPFQFFSHVLWGIAYAFAFEPRAHGSTFVRGLKFSFLPWTFSGMFLYPLVGAGPFGFRLAGPLTIFGDFVQNVVFGITLAALYRLFRLARQPRLHHGHRHGHRHQSLAPVIEEPPAIPCDDPLPEVREPHRTVAPHEWEK
jgi:membrane-associated protein